MTESKLPESCVEHQPKYHSLAWMQYTLAELGQWVHLFVKRAGHRKNAAKRNKDLTDAQNYLDMMQAHIDAAKKATDQAIMPGVLETKAGWEEKPAGVLETKPGIFTELPMVETSEPKLEYKPEPEHEGPLRDAQGNITRISVLAGTPGYDPDAHENKELKIFCDDVHIPTAHTADTELGLVLYYEKDARGRIKTKDKHGKVEIRGI